MLFLLLYSVLVRGTFSFTYLNCKVQNHLVWLRLLCSTMSLVFTTVSESNNLDKTGVCAHMSSLIVVDTMRCELAPAVVFLHAH